MADILRLPTAAAEPGINPKRKGMPQPCPFLVYTRRRCYLEYVGTRDQLIAVGICAPDDFPEGRKRLKQCFQHRDQDSWSVRVARGGRFVVHVWPKEPIKALDRAPRAIPELKLVVSHGR